MYLILTLFFVLYLVYINRLKIYNVYNLYKIFKNTVDPENKKNCCQISYDISKVIYMLFSTTKNNLESFNKKHLKVPYKFRNNDFIFLLKNPRGILPLEYIKDENDNNIFDDIYPYLGPNLDCHGSELYPRDFGLKKISIKNINNQEYVFGENDMIKLN
jgi:hypothetical protein